jgi:hypothetical protein
MAVRSGHCLVWNNRANNYLSHGNSSCRFHGQLSGHRAILRDQHLCNLPEPSRWCDLQLLLDNQFGDDRHLSGHAQRNVSGHRGLYGNGNHNGLSAANSSAASWVHSKKIGCAQHLAHSLSRAGSDGYSGPQYRLRQRWRGRLLNVSCNSAGHEFGLCHPHHPVGTPDYVHRRWWSSPGARQSQCQDSVACLMATTAPPVLSFRTSFKERGEVCPWPVTRCQLSSYLSVSSIEGISPVDFSHLIRL